MGAAVCVCALCKCLRVYASACLCSVCVSWYVCNAQVNQESVRDLIGLMGGVCAFVCRKDADAGMCED